MKKILVLNHFPTVYPPTSGGTLRYFHLYQELSRYYDVTLLSQTRSYKGGLFRYSPTFREYKVESEHPHDGNYESILIHHMENAKRPTRYKKQFSSHYHTSDIIIHESPFLLDYDEHLGSDQKQRIYNSHNHEYLLADRIWRDVHSRKHLPSLFKNEKKLVQQAHLVFATSEFEKDSFIRMYKKSTEFVKVAPNGIHPDEWLPRKCERNKRLQAFFIGSDYLPNMESAVFIVHHLADACPDIDFIIAGGCCEAFLKITKRNVNLLGRVPFKQKLKLLANADVAINPMFTGAGVNLKTLEFMSAGLPLFSTNFGVRGLDLIDQIHYIQAEKEDFAAKLTQFSRDENRLKTIRTNGQTYINERFSWRFIVKNMVHEIEKHLV
jgi:glycosyltransferase involved in cell wall biosynthesis